MAKDADKVQASLRAPPRVDVWLGLGALGVLFLWAALLFALQIGAMLFLPIPAFALFVLVPWVVFELVRTLVRSWARQSWWGRAGRIALTHALLGAAAFFFLSPGRLLSFPLMDRGQEWQVSRAVDLDALQRWTVELLQKPSAEASTDEQDTLDRHRLPKDVQGCAWCAAVHRGNAPEDSYIAFVSGGGFHHYGFLVGATTFTYHSDSQWWVRRWRGGIYGFQDRR